MPCSVCYSMLSTETATMLHRDFCVLTLSMAVMPCVGNAAMGKMKKIMAVLVRPEQGREALWSIVSRRLLAWRPAHF